MSERKPVKTWTRTNIGNLIKHRSGTYYSRLFVGGKQRWRSLGTKVLEVAKAKLREEQRAQGKTVPIVTLARSGRMTMDAAIAVLRNEIEAKLAMPRSKKKRMITDPTGHYRAQTIDALCKTWTEIVGSNLAAMEVRKVTGSDVNKWANVLRERVSKSRFNNTLGTLRRLLDIAIEAGELHHNLAQGIARSFKEPRPTYTPTRDDFPKLVVAIRASSSRYAADSADYVEFLAYAGPRKTEAANLLKKDVDLANDLATFRKTKNGKVRTVELIPEAKALLEKIFAERGEMDPHERIFRVSQAYGSLRAAAKAIGIPRISHHDLRDMFASRAIESGVDAPTIADWFGHQDGGKLLLSTYRKRNDEHARRSAKRVSIGPAPAAENIVPMKTSAA